MKFSILALVVIITLCKQHSNGASIPQTLGQAASGIASNIAANSSTILKNAEIAAGTVAKVGPGVYGNDIKNFDVSSQSETGALGIVGQLGQAASGIASNIAANSGTILKNCIAAAGTVAEIGAGVLGNDIKNGEHEITNANAVSGLAGAVINVADGTADQAGSGILSASGGLAGAAGNIIKYAETGAGTVIKVGAGILRVKA